MRLLYDRDGVQLFLGDARDYVFTDDERTILTGPPWWEEPQLVAEYLPLLRAQLVFCQWNNAFAPPVNLPHIGAFGCFIDAKAQYMHVFGKQWHNIADWQGSIPDYERVNEYPYQFPLTLAINLLKTASPLLPVFDPFCGSGTTLIAARTLGLKAVGIELCQPFANLALRRLSA